jgi:hypothetical protein
VSTEEMCEDCKRLIRAGRYTEPHAALVETKRQSFSSMLGPADETYYRCSTCGHKWLHETGSQGMGWV